MTVTLLPHPILSTLEPVIRRPRFVRLNRDRIENVADWMAPEGLGWPDFYRPLQPATSAEDVIDFIFLTCAINFAFTDFETGEVFRVRHRGTECWDSDAMVACLTRALDEGLPILDGSWLATISRWDGERIFRGNIPIPLLDERLEIFREVGAVLADRYGGRFHNFVAAGPPRAWAGGEGLVERLEAELPSFRDCSPFDGHEVRFAKRAQLLVWMLAARFRDSAEFRVEDLDQLTAFADYILPVAFRIFGIFEYEPALEERIARRQPLEAHSREEVEIRAHTLWAAHLLTEAINRRRPADRQVIVPVIDARLWSHYHETSLPHHLTVTTAY